MKKVLIIGRPEGASELLWANKINLLDAVKSFAEDMNEAAKAIINLGAEPLAFTPVASYHIYPTMHFPYLDKRIKIVSDKDIYEMIDEINAVVLIGMTAKAGTLHAFMDSSYNWVGFHDYIINDKVCGEIGLYKTYFSHFGTPIAFVTGDEAACKEAESELKGVKTLTVKQATCRNKAVKIEGAKERIAAICEEALLNFPIRKKEERVPLTIKIVYNRTEFCDDSVRWHRNTVERIDDRTLQKTINEVKYIYDLIF